MNDDTFANRLTQLREQKGFTARDLSLTMGQGESYINRIENKRSKPSMPAFFMICEYLGISEREFFDIDNKHPERLNELVEDLKKLDDKALEHIAGLVKIIANRG